MKYNDELYEKIMDVLSMTDRDNLFYFLYLSKNKALSVENYDMLYDDIGIIDTIARENQIPLEIVLAEDDFISTAKNYLRNREYEEKNSPVRFQGYIGTELKYTADQPWKIMEAMVSDGNAIIMNCGGIIYGGKIIDRHTGRQVKTW